MPTTDRVSTESHSSIVLYSYALSPYAGKVHAFLNFKQLPFQVHFVNPIKARQELHFTGDHMVPVLGVGDQWLADSTPIGIWLDTLYPDNPPLLPEEESVKKQLLDIDNWVSDSLIAGNFRALIEAPAAQRRRNFWRAASIVNATVEGGLAKPWQWAWPWLAPRATFIQKLIASLPSHESVAEMQQRHCKEFIQYLDGENFLGGMNQPSIADFSAYHQIVNHHRAGYQGFDIFLDYEPIVDWVKLIQPYAEAGVPTLPPHCIERDFIS